MGNKKPVAIIKWVVGRGGPSTDRVIVWDEALVNVIGTGFKTLKAARAHAEAAGYEVK